MGSERRRSVYLFIRRMINQTVVIIGMSLLSTKHKILSIIMLSRLTPYTEKITVDH